MKLCIDCKFCEHGGHTEFISTLAVCTKPWIDPVDGKPTRYGSPPPCWSARGGMLCGASGEGWEEKREDGKTV